MKKSEGKYFIFSNVNEPVEYSGEPIYSKIDGIYGYLTPNVDNDILFFFSEESAVVYKTLKGWKLRAELTYDERILWFMQHNYETGMEYEKLLEECKNDDLDNFEWYDEIVKIPKYLDECD